MTTYKIEKGVPLKRINHKYPFEELEIGDSFFVEVEKGQSVRDLVKDVRNYVSYYSKILGCKFTTRSNIKGIRVWRIDK